jgi:hypothetical protein
METTPAIDCNISLVHHGVKILTGIKTSSRRPDSDHVNPPGPVTTTAMTTPRRRSSQLALRHLGFGLLAADQVTKSSRPAPGPSPAPDDHAPHRGTTLDPLTVARDTVGDQSGTLRTW